MSSTVEFKKKPEKLYVIEYSPNGYVHACLTEQNFLKVWNQYKANGNTHLQAYIYEPRNITADTEQKALSMYDHI